MERMQLIRRGFATLGPVVPQLAGRLALKLYLTPQRHERPDRETSWLSSARPVELRLGSSGALSGYQWGAANAPTVLLVHGWSGRGSQLGAFAEPLVRSGFHVLAIDGPAHGESPGSQTDPLQFAAALGAVGRTYGPLAAVVAHSFGAVATTIALFDGLEADRVVYIGAPARPRDSFTHFASMLDLPESVAANVQLRLAQRVGDRSWDTMSPVEIARGLSIPALIIHDIGDKDVPHDHGEELAAAWPDARLQTTEGLGHHRILRDNGVIADAVAFIEAPAHGADGDTPAWAQQWQAMSSAVP